jgi:short-subunit dehydrogenase
MFKNRRVIVTGASAGIGRELAHRFAADGASLLLVARRADVLEELAAELREKGGAAAAHTCAIDLAAEGACEEVVKAATSLMGGVDVLINNAGIGEYGAFVDKTLDENERMMRLNMSALVKLTQLCLPSMLERREGWIMNVSSMAAYQPTPYMSLYGATKSFVLNFSWGLWAEVRDRGVVVTCVCPGPVRTGFFSRGGYEVRMRDFSKVMVEPAWIAEQAYRALVRGRAAWVPGRMNRFSIVVQRFFSTSFVARLTAKLLKPRGSAKPEA